MKVCFLVSDLSRSGGVDVLLGHAEGLRADHGLDVDVVATADAAGVAGREYDVAISTWWETAPLLWRLNARTRLAFLQSAEECFYTDDEPLERLGAALALRAADGYLAISSWLAELVRGLRPEAPVELVPNGIDKSVFDGRRGERAAGPLRVLVEGQPTLWFKGVAQAAAALREVGEPIETTLVCPNPADAADVAVDRVVGGLSAAEMADLYAASDVLVKLSAVEGLGLAPLEGFHHGVPCIVTPYGGHADYVRHGENGFVVGFDDLGSVTRLVDRLARDPELLARLSAGARATAAAWPDSRAATARFAEALDALQGAAGTPPVAAALDAWRVAAELDRPLRGMLRWHERALADTRTALDEQFAHVARLNELVKELEASRAHVNELVLQRDREIAELTASRTYRAAEAARNLVHRVRR